MPKDQQPSTLDDDDRVTTQGALIFLDGRYLAVAKDEESALIIAICLNRSGLSSFQWPLSEARDVAEFFA